MEGDGVAVKGFATAPARDLDIRAVLNYHRGLVKRNEDIWW